MRVAILCPGPSLARAEIVGYDMTIGVNRAVLHRACDWWACIDWPLYRRVWEESGGPLGEPRVFTVEPSAEAIRKRETLRDRFEAANPLTMELLPTYDRTAQRELGGRKLDFIWWSYTTPAAVMLAVHLGASLVDLHGADMSGNADFDGAIDGGDRSDTRWTDKEWPLLCMATGYARERGVAVRRIFPADTPMRSF